MPARIVVAHDDRDFLHSLVTALRKDGHDVAAFDDPMSAWDALDAAKKVELLITRIRFENGTTHGVALARRALSSRPGVRILFTALPEMRVHGNDLGIFLAMPVSATEVAETVNRMLNSDGLGKNHVAADESNSSQGAQPSNGFRIEANGTHFSIIEAMGNGTEVVALRFHLEEGFQEWVATYLRQRQLEHMIDWVRSKAQPEAKNRRGL